ncbi:MAG: serine/threonine protein kinase [Planctomycetes bacterium]|nr:serine/threonine protein kinase [Planctomycetota bacterium]
MSAAETDDVFAKVLVESGLLSAEKIEAARKTKVGSTERSLGDILIEDGALSSNVKEILESRIREGHTGPMKRLGNFLIAKKLGEGSMGGVFLGLEIHADAPARPVAIKVLKKELTQGSKALIDRFVREATSASKLQHENIVSAKGAGEVNGMHYYAMDYVEGEPLDAVLKRESKLPINRALQVTIDAAKGLGYAHGLGFIHRDIKPANIYLTKGGPAKVLDFGLVKNVLAPEQDALTITGTVMGSPHYISPDQARGDKGVDLRTDIYSLGATLFHMVCGNPPFRGNSPATVIMMHISQPPPAPIALSPDIPPGLSQIILTMLAKDRESRYPNCAVLVEDLEEVQAGREPKFKPTSGSPDANEIMPTVLMAPEVLDKTTLLEPTQIMPKKKKSWWQFWK